MIRASAFIVILNFESEKTLYMNFKKEKKKVLPVCTLTIEYTRDCSYFYLLVYGKDEVNKSDVVCVLMELTLYLLLDTSTDLIIGYS